MTQKRILVAKRLLEYGAVKFGKDFVMNFYVHTIKKNEMKIKF